MKKIWQWIKLNPNRAMFLVPILLVAGISISHVVSWYNLANPINWAIYLSIAIEVGAMTALIAATNKIKGGVWFMFGLVTFIQMIGNIFFSYKEIDESGKLFKSWVELTSPVWESFGTDITDVISLKRWLAFLEGGLLPIISLTSLHFFIKYDDNRTEKIEESSEDNDVIPEKIEYPFSGTIEPYSDTTYNNIPNIEQIVEEDVVQDTVEYVEEDTVQDNDILTEPTITDLTEEVNETTNEVEEDEEQFKYETSQYFDIQDQLTPVTTTTTDDGIRRLTYTKPS
jgi:hypothetical protein